MSRILKSITFESERSIVLNIPKLASALLPDPAEASFGVGGAHLPQDIEETTDPEATALLNEAQKHVEMMLNQAQVQVSTWQEEAQQAGWQTGYAEARQAVEAELAEALVTARNLAQSAVEAYQQFLEENQAELGRLAVAIAEKIIGKELSLNPRAITDIVAQAIYAANIRGACCIRVNPKDYEIIEPHWSAIPSLQPSGQSWELVSDQRINPGGCLIEVSGGTIDAQLETQLEQVVTALQS